MYTAAIKISPWNQMFLNNAAYQYYLRRDYKQAEQLYVRLLNLQPDFLLSYSMLANAELMLGDAAQADRNLEPLESKLQEDSFVKLKGNQGTWEFEVLGQTNLVALYSAQEKVAYLRYVLALARQLAGHPQEARRELQEAAAESHGHDTSQARHVLVSDISSLETARPEYAKQLHEFRVALEAK
jgi:tetratricopeptide (TPR) repeat protein